MNKIILASKSPRRLEILRKHGIDPVVIPSNTEEILPEGIGMEDAVKLLAEQKARSVYEQIDKNKYQDYIIIGSDTVVYSDEIMGKPVDEQDAFRMLSKIRATSHYVATGLAVIDVNTGKTEVICDITTVYCKDYPDDEIYEYIRTEKPYDKAGSYAIQGPWSQYIDHIDGDYENVVGLPFYRLQTLVRVL